MYAWWVGYLVRSSSRENGSLPPKSEPSPGTPAKGKTGPDAVEEPKGADADGGDGE